MSIVYIVGRWPLEMAQNYEFDAPSHVFDLKELEHADDADHWFGESSLCHSVPVPRLVGLFNAFVVFVALA